MLIVKLVVMVSTQKAASSIAHATNLNMISQLEVLGPSFKSCTLILLHLINFPLDGSRESPPIAEGVLKFEVGETLTYGGWLVATF